MSGSMNERRFQVARHIEELLHEEARHDLNMLFVIAELSAEEQQFLEEFGRRCQAQRHCETHEFGWRVPELA